MAVYWEADERISGDERSERLDPPTFESFVLVRDGVRVRAREGLASFTKPLA